MYFISSGGDAFFTKNSRSKFSNVLLNPLQGIGKTIILESVHLQKHFNTIPDGEVIVLVIKKTLQIEEQELLITGVTGNISIFEYIFIYNDPIFLAVIKIKRGFYESNYFITEYNKFTKEFFGGKFLLKMGVNNRIKLNVEKNSNIYISMKLAKVLGFSKAQRALYKTKKKFDFRGFKSKINNIIFMRIKSSIQCENEYNKKVLLPKIIKIYCNEIVDTVESSSRNKLLAILPGVEKNDGNSYNYELMTNVSVPLSSSYINSIDFELKDEYDNRLEFAAGFATYLKTSINSMNNKIQDTYLTCFSGDAISKKLYPNNKNNSFTVMLAEELTKGHFEKWDMALLNASLPTATSNILDGKNYIKIESLNDDSINYIAKLPIGLYTEHSNFINVLQEDLKKNAKINLSVAFERKFRLVNKNPITIQVTMPVSLALIMGFISDVLENKSTHTFKIGSKKIFTAGFDANFKMAEHLFCKITCEQVKDTYFGGAAEKLLRFMPISGLQVGKSTFHEFYSKHFVEINSSNLTKLTFSISQENTPDLLKFDNQSVNTNFGLLIRRY